MLFETGILYRSKVIPYLRLRFFDVFIPLPRPYHFEGNTLVRQTIVYFFNHKAFFSETFNSKFTGERSESGETIG